MIVVRTYILFFFSLAAGACSPNPAAYAPPPEPLTLYPSEPALNAALGKTDPFLALRLLEAHPQFASPRVRIILLETLVELGSYEKACSLGEELLKLTDSPKKNPKNLKKPAKKSKKIEKKAKNIKNSKKTEKKPPKKSVFPQYLTESQRHKIYFNLSLAYEGLKNSIKAEEYFEKTTERPNYYYLYRYAQNRIGAGDGDRALLLLKESYERSHGKFSYINEAYADLLTRQAFIIYKKKPSEAKANLASVLGDEQLKKCPAASRAEILWHQWF